MILNSGTLTNNTDQYAVGPIFQVISMGVFFLFFFYFLPYC